MIRKSETTDDETEGRGGSGASHHRDPVDDANPARPYAG